jgi:hypothetical protein
VIAASEAKCGSAFIRKFHLKWSSLLGASSFFFIIEKSYAALRPLLIANNSAYAQAAGPHLSYLPLPATVFDVLQFQFWNSENNGHQCSIDGARRVSVNRSLLFERQKNNSVALCVPGGVSAASQPEEPHCSRAPFGQIIRKL